nr:hypothetical protein [Tanacetum cinerariifolium]
GQVWQMGVHAGNPQRGDWLIKRVMQSTGKIKGLEGNQRLKDRIRDGGACVGA